MYSVGVLGHRGAVVKLESVELVQQAITRTFYSNCVSFLNEVVGFLSVCTIFNLDLDAVRDLSVKELAYKFHFRFCSLLFI
jgi:hypothetical protein